MINAHDSEVGAQIQSPSSTQPLTQGIIVQNTGVSAKHLFYAQIR